MAVAPSPTVTLPGNDPLSGLHAQTLNELRHSYETKTGELEESAKNLQANTEQTLGPKNVGGGVNAKGEYTKGEGELAQGEKEAFRRLEERATKMGPTSGMVAGMRGNLFASAAAKRFGQFQRYQQGEQKYTKEIGREGEGLTQKEAGLFQKTLAELPKNIAATPQGYPPALPAGPTQPGYPGANAYVASVFPGGQAEQIRYSKMTPAQKEQWNREHGIK